MGYRKLRESYKGFSRRCERECAEDIVFGNRDECEC